MFELKPRSHWVNRFRIVGARAGTEKGLTMKKVLTTVLVAAAFSATSAYAADLKALKAAPAPVAIVSPWDVAFGAWIASDYNFRGITQSAPKPAVGGYLRTRSNVHANRQGHFGIGARQ